MTPAVVLLDSGPAGWQCVTPGRSAEASAHHQWAEQLELSGCKVFLPEIVDYELRREYLRRRRRAYLRRLDFLATRFEYLAITTVVMRRAAELWALARQQGLPTAEEACIDADVILAAQAQMLGVDDYVIATSNLQHLSRMAKAAEWQTIQPNEI